MRIPEKERHLNPKTNRLKNFRHIRYLTTKIPVEERTLKNLPRYANGKTKVRFQDWLKIDTKKRHSDHSVPSFGWSPNSKCYGWSHRAIHGFHKDELIKPGTIGNKYQYGKDFKSDEEYEKAGKFRPYKIKTDKEAEEHAIRFARDVS